MSFQERKTYSEKLRDPRWQRRRLEIFQRDEFTCQSCLDKDQTLNVHHRRYVRGREPWEYQDWELVTLCETCHAEEGERWPAEIAAIEGVFQIKGFFASDVNNLMDVFFNFPGDARYLVHVFGFIARHPEAFNAANAAFQEWIETFGRHMYDPVDTSLKP